MIQPGLPVTAFFQKNHIQKTCRHWKAENGVIYCGRLIVPYSLIMG
jgi:hypothetical protein